MDTQEIKDLEQRAYGKPILFIPRHWTLYEWVKEQPGRSLRDKLWGVVNRAYRADYSRRGRLAMGRYFDVLSRGTYPDLDWPAVTKELCEACECFSRAGLHDDEERARDLLRVAVRRQAA